jgi:ribonuclease P protein component
VERLKRRTDFRAAATSGLKAPGRALVLQARQRPPTLQQPQTLQQPDDGMVRVGFTVSRQVGNAVERNRVRRRLREIVRLTAAGQMQAGHDYVLIGRRAALAAPFADMIRELDTALTRVHTAKRGPRGGTGGAGARPLHEAGSPGAADCATTARDTPAPNPRQNLRKEP